MVWVAGIMWWPYSTHKVQARFWPFGKHEANEGFQLIWIRLLRASPMPLHPVIFPISRPSPNYQVTTLTLPLLFTVSLLVRPWTWDLCLVDTHRGQWWATEKQKVTHLHRRSAFITVGWPGFQQPFSYQSFYFHWLPAKCNGGRILYC